MHIFPVLGSAFLLILQCSIIQGEEKVPEADGSKADHIVIYPESNNDPGYLQMFIWAFRKEARPQAIQN